MFELAYGAGATMVLTAHVGDDPAQQKFVTLIAQPDLYGNVLVLLKSVTDTAHLDETPRLRLVEPSTCLPITEANCFSSSVERLSASLHLSCASRPGRKAICHRRRGVWISIRAESSLS